MRPTRSDVEMAMVVLVLVTALACGGATSDRKAQPGGAGDAAQPAGEEAVSLMVPSGSVLSIEFEEGLSSAESKAGDSFRAKLSEPVYVGEQIAIGVGATVSGKVIDVRPATRAGGKAQLNVEFTELELASGRRVTIDATFYTDSQPRGETEIGAAVLGRMNSDAAVADAGGATEEIVIGAIVGTENGTAVAASNDGQEVSIPVGTMLKIQLGASVVLSAEA